MAEPIPLQTANGIIQATHDVEIRVRELKIKVRAIVLTDSPPVLSLGKLVEENGFDYIWRHGEDPILISPGGKSVRCQPSHNVPFITTGLQCGGSKPAEGDLKPEEQDTLHKPSEPEKPKESTTEAASDCKPKVAEKPKKPLVKATGKKKKNAEESVKRIV